MYDEKIPTGRCYLNFPDNGVEIFIPPQKEPIKVIAEMFSFDYISSDEDEFTPFRAVIKFEVRDKNNGVVSTFKPPIELKVFFTKKDKDKLNNDNKVVIGYLVEKDDKEKEKWVLFKDSHHLRQHDLEDSDLSEGNPWAGYFTVEISDWGDPSVSVGQ